MSVSRFTSYSQAEESRYWEAMGMAMVGDIELTPAEVAAIEPCKLHLALAGQIALVDRKTKTIASLTDENISEIKQLADQGLSQEKIAEIARIAPRDVSRVLCGDGGGDV